MRFGRPTSVDDLPPKTKLRTYIKRAMKLNDEGVPAPHVVKRKTRKPLPVPTDLRAALSKDDKANTEFEAFPPSHRREYIQWITEAKTAETRERRIATAVEWIAEGKGRNWKYER